MHCSNILVKFNYLHYEKMYHETLKNAEFYFIKKNTLYADFYQ